MTRRLVTVTCLLALLLVSAQAAAQTTTGTIDGVIRGPDGRPLPGVTVVANSPSMIWRDASVVSNADGFYRLALLPPGTYELAYRLQGFRALQRPGLTVRVGQTTSVDIGLQLAPVQETEVVVGNVPNIDPRSAKLAFNYTAELSENIPTARSVHDLFATIPGVESVNNLGGGLQPGTIEVQNVLGAGERSSSYWLDGANTTDPAGQWNVQGLMPYDVIQEVQVVKAAKPAEVAFQGGLFNVITKSGGNRLAGQVGAYFADQSLQSTNSSGIDVEVANELIREYDLTGSIGGRIVPDSLWWHAAARHQKGTSTIFGFPADIDERITSASGKLTYQPNARQRFNAIFTTWDQEVSHFFFGYSPALAQDERASVFRPVSGATMGARWSGILSDRVVAESSINYTRHGFDQKLQPDGDVAIVDLVTGQRSRSAGGSAGALREQDNELWSFNGSISWFVPEAAGRHDLKAGVEYLPTRAQIQFGEPGDHQLHTLFGRKFAVRFLNTPTTAIWDNDLLSFYAQDSWTIADRLTLNLGVRYMHTDAGTPEQPAGGGRFANTALADRFPQLNATTLAPTDLVTWDSIEPRFAGTYLLDRAGRTVLRFGASRYYQNLESFGLFVLTPAFPFTFVTLWFDRNDDFAYQVGEEGPLLFSFGGQLNQVDPNIRRPYTNELLLGLSHEPSDKVQVSANFIYRKDHDLTNTVDVGVPFSSYTPVDIVDPGADGVVGTSDDGTLTVYAQDPATIGQSRLMLTNPDNNERTYRGVELTVSKQLADNWQGVASLVVSEMEVIKPTTALQVPGLFDNPNGLVNAKGLDPTNQTVQLKLQGTYLLDFGLGVSGVYRFRTGNPYTREIVVTGMPQGPFNVRAEPRGSSRTDSSSNLDLRLEQTLDVPNGQLGLILDVFNVFNAAPVVDEGTITGVNYGEPLSLRTPRIARLGLRFTW